MQLDVAKDQYEKALSSGRPVRCPCCGRMGRIYKRRLNAGMAAILVRLYFVSYPELGRWVSIEELFGSRKQDKRDWPLLAHWGLIEPQSTRTLTENARGYWRITDLGARFVRGDVTVPVYHHVYDGSVVDSATQQTSIRAALGTKFDYASLMAGRPG